jgi:hypothetical protein
MEIAMGGWFPAETFLTLDEIRVQFGLSGRTLGRVRTRLERDKKRLVLTRDGQALYRLRDAHQAVLDEERDREVMAAAA